MKHAKDVDEYIAFAPEDVQGKLKELRFVIRSVAPSAKEKISYGMPYYSYKGRLIYFGYAKHHVALYPMPPSIDGIKKELKKYQTGKATLRFQLDKELPIALIKKVIKAGIKRNEEAEKMKTGQKWKTCSRGHKYQGSSPCPICWPGRNKRKVGTK